MAGVRESQGQLVFGLDIGTRSIVGTVGYLSGKEFHVMAQKIAEQEPRAMMDGQIHDIGQVGNSIRMIKEQLEEDLSRELTEVCIAAAGRVLQTVTVRVDQAFEQEKEVTQEDIYALSMSGIEQAYEVFQKDNKTGMKFYCVGYTPMHYYLNDYQIGNLEGHKARSIGADLIATFLPDDVVDGLYKSVDLAGLHVANLTLEPIAAIEVAIPEKFRLLNLALVDVGAGTSDICITREGTIVAYGMIPTAGDSLTDLLVQECLVDFETAERIKRSACGTEPIPYTDIMGMPNSITPKKVLRILKDGIDRMTGLVADEIMKLNGDKTVSAVFVVGGGGTIPGYTDKLTTKLGLQKGRVAIRGEEVMQSIRFDIENAMKDSTMVTPIGICLSYYEQSNNFIFVELNGEKLKLYDNGRLSVSDAAMQVSLSNEDLFPKRGTALTFTVNGKSRIVRGHQGEAAVITINGNPADLHAQIHSGDIISIIPSTAGDPAVMELSALTEMREELRVSVNGKMLQLPRTADVGGNLVTAYYEIQDGDDISIHNFYKVSEIAEILDLPLGGNIRVNGTPANPDTRVYEDFTLDFDLTANVSYDNLPEDDGTYVPSAQRIQQENEKAGDAENAAGKLDRNESSESFKKAEESASTVADAASEADAAAVAENADGAEEKEKENIPTEPIDLHIVCNKLPLTLIGKPTYVFVDVFDYISFDLTNAGGRSIVTTINGKNAEYMEMLHEGDILEIYWKN